MSDELDRVAEHAVLLINAQIQTVKNSLSQRVLQPRGMCHYCDSAVGAEQLYCDDDCANWHAEEEAARVRNHGVRPC